MSGSGLQKAKPSHEPELRLSLALCSLRCCRLGFCWVNPHHRRPTTAHDWTSAPQVTSHPARLVLVFLPLRLGRLNMGLACVPDTMGGLSPHHTHAGWRLRQADVAVDQDLLRRRRPGLRLIGLHRSIACASPLAAHSKNYINSRGTGSTRNAPSLVGAYLRP